MINKPSIFITGAANGIGRTTAKTFAKLGWFVGISDVQLDLLEQLAEELGSEHCIAIALDVTSSEQWQEALAFFYQKTQRLDCLVNNAGILSSGDFQNIELEKQQLMIDVNVKGVLNGCYAAFEYLKRTDNAKIINLSSASAIYGQPSLATYSASKFAIKGLTEALNLEWESYDIHVMSVMPLFVKTDMVVDMDAKTIDLLGVQLTPMDVAEYIVKLAIESKSKRKVHQPVGFKAKVMHFLADISPSVSNRYINKLLGVRNKTSR